MLPGRGLARLGRLARLLGPCLDRPGDRGRALRRQARRPGRPPDLLARRDPGRRDLVRASRRHRPRASGPLRDRRRARRRPAARPGRALRVRDRPRRAARHRPRPGARASGSPSSARPAPASRRSVACSQASIRRGSGSSRSEACGSSTCRSTRCGPRWRSSPRSSTCSSAPSPTICASPGREPPTSS